MSYATFSTLSTQERFTPAYYKWQKPSFSIKDFIRRCGEGKEKLPAIMKVEMTTDLKRRARSKGLMGAGEVSKVTRLGWWGSDVRVYCGLGSDVTTYLSR